MQFWHPPIFQIGAWYMVVLTVVALINLSKSTAFPSSNPAPITHEASQNL
jgi:hypothetical protein